MFLDITSIENIPNDILGYDLICLIYKSSQRIYEQLGSGHAESTYQKALLYELSLYNISIDIERHINVVYEDSKGNKHFLTSERIDLYIHKNNLFNESDIILELKAVSKSIQEQEIVQINKYVKQLKKDNIDIKFGIIINFPQPTSKSTSDNINFLITYSG
jgi:GxxExxY protein